ncbi:MAG TPA: aminotransferase class V-fold PLP-dependent enzyme, partial [bacterium]|nr:aminotransferase class V-fold PLP-dependent enzyme [bacterium]
MKNDKPAIEGGTPVRSEPLPYATQWIREEEIAAVTDTLKSTWLTTGPKVKEFEVEFARYIGAPHVVAVNSCTAALNLSVVGAGIGPGDEVITTPMTFIATTLAIVHAGAKPVFADIDPDTLNIDPKDIEKRITPRTRAIMPVHYAGNPADLDAIIDIAARRKLKV